MLLPLVGVVGMVTAEPARLKVILVMFRHGLAPEQAITLNHNAGSRVYSKTCRQFCSNL
jgi:hypothetical protein